jgi:hypothetical protein
MVTMAAISAVAYANPNTVIVVTIADSDADAGSTMMAMPVMTPSIAVIAVAISVVPIPVARLCAAGERNGREGRGQCQSGTRNLEHFASFWAAVAARRRGRL